MRVIKAILLVLLAVATGIGVAIYKIAGIENSPALFKNGCWMGSTNLPLGKDNLVTAQVTIFALFALPSDEAVYLFARRDNKGDLLTGENDYVIRGNIKNFNAKYWSITAYGKDLYLIPNQVDRYSFNNNSIAVDSAGNFTINLSHLAKDGNWLSTPENKRFNLVLRFYVGNKAFIGSLPNAKLPTIEKLSKP